MNVPGSRLTYGDNTLAAESASYCKQWKSTVLARELKNLDHMGILFDRSFNEFVVSLVSGIPILREIRDVSLYAIA